MKAYLVIEYDYDWMENYNPWSEKVVAVADTEQAAIDHAVKLNKKLPKYQGHLPGGTPADYPHYRVTEVEKV